MDIKNEINLLIEKLTKYQASYYKEAISLISDEEFDALYDRLQKLEKEYPEFKNEFSPTQKVGSDLDNTFKKIKHSIKILSLDKANLKSNLLNFLNRIFIKNSYLEYFIIDIQEKIDGLSLVLYYEDGILIRGLTRGDGYVGNDVTNNIKTIYDIPLKLNKKVNLIVRGEVYLYKNDFLKIKEKKNIEYSNSRNFASGALMRKNNTELKGIPLRFFVHEAHFQEDIESNTKITQKEFNEFLKENKKHIYLSQIEIFNELKNLGFNINDNDEMESFKVTKDNLEQDLDNIMLFLDKKTLERENNKRDIDGMVLKVDDLSLQKKLGFTSHHPKYAIAFKFDAIQTITKIEDIILQVGRSGKITPVAILEKVKLQGSQIQKSTLHNQQYIKQLNLNIGDIVNIAKQGDIIPAVKNVIEKRSTDYFKLSDYCLSCKTKLVLINDIKHCRNYLCKERKKARISFFIGKKQMDIVNLGGKTIDFFIQKEIINDIDDIYHINFDDIKKILLKQKNYLYIQSYKTKIVKHKQYFFKIYKKIFFNQNDFFSFKDKKLQNLKISIKESKKASFAKVLLSLGIKDLGQKNIDLLFNFGFKNIDDFKNIKKNHLKLRNIFGISNKTLNNLKIEFENKSFLKLLNRLNKSLNMKRIIDNNKNDDIDLIDRDYFYLKKWCITGKFDTFKSKEDIKKEIQQRGGTVLYTISKNTDYLLIRNDISRVSKKLKKTSEYNIKIIQEEEFNEILRG